MFFFLNLASDQDKADLCVDEIQVRQDGVSLGKKAAVERPIFFFGKDIAIKLEIRSL